MHYATQPGVQVKTVISLVPGFVKFTKFFYVPRVTKVNFLLTINQLIIKECGYENLKK